MYLPGPRFRQQKPCTQRPVRQAHRPWAMQQENWPPTIAQTWWNWNRINPRHLDEPARLRSELEAALDRYEAAYHKYFVTNQAKKDADLVELEPNHPLLLGLGRHEVMDAWIFAGDRDMIRSVWVAGNPLIENGRHAREEEIERAFRSVIKSLREQ